MPNTIEDKISLFTKVIIERMELDFNRKQEKLVEYHENRKRNIINQYEEKKIVGIEKTTKYSETKKQHLVLKTRSDMHLALLKKKQEFTERVTSEVKKRIITFIDTDEYTEFLVKAIKQALSTFTENQFIIFNFSRNDVANKQEIILKTIRCFRNKDTYQINTLDNLLGGFYVKTGDGRMEIDFTINSILEESDKLIGKILSSRLSKEHCN